MVEEKWGKRVLSDAGNILEHQLVRPVDGSMQLSEDPAEDRKGVLNTRTSRREDAIVDSIVPICGEVV